MNIYPEKFEVSIGGFFGPSFEVHLQKDGTLLYMDSPDRIPEPRRYYKKEGITVSEDQWREFRKALDNANVWSWKEYYDSDILDGTQWELTIKYRDAFVSSGGSNNYPPEEEFKQFEVAVRQLIGGKDFQ
ncbi:MAG: hypothetical protein R6V22_10360 [Rhodohalobacter sp.]|uniref:hypothetical protein n=1 Tax=Rhodohalobacter sp. TaxID=1974210 RepID=UPI0039747640